MENKPEILGYILCKTCKEPKAIKQGKGKRKNYVHGRCACGPDTRTGIAAQAELSAFKPLADVQSDIAALATPAAKPNVTAIIPNTTGIIAQKETETKPNTETEKDTEMGTIACVGVGAVVGLIFGGLIKSLKAVA
ncbi:MAG: hypothetical protein ACI86X_000681 [Moritella sp.]|jgi:hypothetical protein